jgi:hypothetical protein
VKLPLSARWKEGSHFVVKVRDAQIVVESSPRLVAAADVMAIGDVA